MRGGLAMPRPRGEGAGRYLPSLGALFRWASLSGGLGDTTAARATRVPLYVGVLAAVSAGLFALRATALVVTTGAFPFGRGELVHVVAAAALGVAFVVARRAGPRTLSVLDGVVTVGLGAAAPGMMLDAAPALRPELLLLLAGCITLATRAALIPSSSRRTLALGVVALLPTVVFAAQLTRLGPLEGMRWAPMRVVMVAGWSAAIVFVTAVVSHVIHGLGRRVREAMKLGQYRLGRTLGEGAMGAVYEGRHELLRRPAAIKLLPPEKVGQRAIARFEQEVRQTCRLAHPNNVAIYDYGRTGGGVFYYAMELLDGMNLQELVAECGPLPAGRVIHLIRQAAEALDEAHGLGLVHRDVKPSNLMVCDRGGVPDMLKVVDYGLVKTLGPDDPGLTRAGGLAGTPAYMAPEAIRTPESLDHRADLYALGGVAYFLLTGGPVFPGRTAVEVCASHLHDLPVPPSVRNPDVPADLEAVVLSCLAKDRKDRPADARALIVALEACVDAARWTRGEARAFWALRRASSSQPSPGARHLDVSLAGRTR